MPKLRMNGGTPPLHPYTRSQHAHRQIYLSFRSSVDIISSSFSSSLTSPLSLYHLPLILHHPLFFSNSSLILLRLLLPSSIARPYVPRSTSATWSLDASSHDDPRHSHKLLSSFCPTRPTLALIPITLQ
jgi:hypothetical protein